MVSSTDADGRVAVMAHPAREPEIASLIVEAYGLSRREREVARLVLQGRSTRELADDLHVSTYTVQDRLKAVFAKVGGRQPPGVGGSAVPAALRAEAGGRRQGRLGRLVQRPNR